MAGNGKEYLVIANEGDDKEYEWDNKAVWTEMVRGKVSSPEKEFVIDNLLVRIHHTD